MVSYCREKDSFFDHAVTETTPRIYSVLRHSEAYLLNQQRNKPYWL